MLQEESEQRSSSSRQEDNSGAEQRNSHQCSNLLGVQSRERIIARRISARADNRRKDIYIKGLENQLEMKYLEDDVMDFMFNRK